MIGAMQIFIGVGENQRILDREAMGEIMVMDGRVGGKGDQMNSFEKENPIVHAHLCTVSLL